MAVDDKESVGEKVVEFFTQSPEDRAYEEAGGDARVPATERTDDPKTDANAYALSNEEPEPYSGYAPAGEAAVTTPVTTDDGGEGYGLPAAV